ncbi:MAG: ABC transporter substrate-binding protein [Chloroflexi bacterium]|nr:ABC transporter substrate-binding protein [Chloroflexota bacterium]
MSKRYSFTVVVVVAALLLAACSTPAPAAPTAAPKDTTPIKVGAIFDLTGATADVGTPYSEGLKGYVEWKNAAGGINGRKIDLLSADYAYKVDQSEALYSQYVGEKVVVFMGWGTGDTEALRPKIANDKIPFMSASYAAGLLDMSQAPYNFLIGTSYSDQGIIAVRWALDDWKKAGKSGTPKVAVIHHNSPFGQSPLEDTKKFAEANGVTFTSLPFPAGTDYTAELGRIQTFGANYVIIHTISSPTAVLMKNAKSLGLLDKMKFISLNWGADELFIKLAGDASEGVVGVLPFTPPTYRVPGHDDPDKFLKSKGGSLDEKGLHYSQGWWTMATMAEGIKKTLDANKPLTGENIKASLESMQNFETGGITAPISFSATSHKGNSSTRLYQVKSGKWAQISDFVQAK